MAPADEAELARAIATAVEIDDRPSAFRYPRGEGTGAEIPALALPYEIGKGRIVREGTAVAILSFGTRLGEALKAADMLAARGLSATVADARFAKPLDVDLVLRLASSTRPSSLSRKAPSVASAPSSCRPSQTMAHWTVA